MFYWLVPSKNLIYYLHVPEQVPPRGLCYEFMYGTEGIDIISAVIQPVDNK